MTTPQQPGKEAIEIHCHGIESMKPEQQQAIGKMCKLAAEYFGKPQPVSENKTDVLDHWRAAMIIGSLINQQKDGGYPIEKISNYLKKRFVTREEHERVKELVQVAFERGFLTAREAITDRLKHEACEDFVKKELEG